MSRRRTLAALLLTIAIAGCGGSGDEPEPAPAPEPAPSETVDHLPQLPDDWTPYVNRRGGYALGLPRGWTAERRGANTLIRSYDRLVAISIASDRSAGGLEVPISDYASRAAEALPGFEDGLEVKAGQPFPHRYEGIEVRAVGIARNGIDQRTSVIVLRRGRVATLTIVIAKNAELTAGPSKGVAERIVETLRSRPPQPAGN